MPSSRPVMFAGIHLGDLQCVGKEDWKNREREPTPLDFENVRVTLAARAVHSILERFPKRPAGRDDAELWPVTVVKAVCFASKGRQDVPFDEDVLRAYVGTYGLGQIIRCVGGDPNRVAEAIGRMLSESG